MKFAKLAVAAIALAATPALANDQVAAGATVTGPEGNAVGTIVSVENGQAVLDTGKHKVPLGVDMYGQGEAGPTITVTKAQLDGMIDGQLAEAAAKRDAALVVGAEAMAADHAALGTILEINGDNIILARGGDEMNKVTLLRDHFDATDHGLMARLTNAQIDAAMAQAAPASSDAAE
ncbi:hypothetical protein [Qipengyuania psychrotolerans]|uniref:Uncharacterized protein n=1 Tax=Qipengyuania psychrotolerans TaxID=2867238 RepID=A0ABX8ZFC7_9SPHN|nr:hypothetical protein [Qipengyuania psychrotolerans]QZD87722.1 hypothetical protein K3166_03210 [Qipengyuania psychrotolerans]